MALTNLNGYGLSSNSLSSMVNNVLQLLNNNGTGTSAYSYSYPQTSYNNSLFSSLGSLGSTGTGLYSSTYGSTLSPTSYTGTLGESLGYQLSGYGSGYGSGYSSTLSPFSTSNLLSSYYGKTIGTQTTQTNTALLEKDTKDGAPGVDSLIDKYAKYLFNIDTNVLENLRQPTENYISKDTTDTTKKTSSTANTTTSTNNTVNNTVNNVTNNVTNNTTNTTNNTTNTTAEKTAAEKAAAEKAATEKAAAEKAAAEKAATEKAAAEKAAAEKAATEKAAAAKKAAAEKAAAEKAAANKTNYWSYTVKSGDCVSVALKKNSSLWNKYLDQANGNVMNALTLAVQKMKINGSSVKDQNGDGKITWADANLIHIGDKLQFAC